MQIAYFIQTHAQNLRNLSQAAGIKQATAGRRTNHCSLNQGEMPLNSTAVSTSAKDTEHNSIAKSSAQS